MHAKDTEEDPTVLCCWPGDGWVRGAVVRRISLSLAVWDLECTDYSTSHNTGGGGAIVSSARAAGPVIRL